MFLLSLLSPRNILLAIGAAAVAACVYFATDFIHDKGVAEAEVARLEQVVTAKTEAVRILTQAAVQRNSAQEVADATRSQLATLQTSYDEISHKVDQANAEQDGQIAPVLRDVLNSLGGLRAPNSGQ